MSKKVESFQRKSKKVENDKKETINYFEENKGIFAAVIEEKAYLTFLSVN